MTLTTRLDTVPIREPYVDKDTGFLHVKRVPIARAMVQMYRKADGSTDREAKLPTEILSDATVASANNKPVTDNHPHGLVNTSNSKELMKGLTDSKAHVEGDMLFNDITITDPDLIKEITQGGKRELSIGFQTEVVPESGEYNGVKYDAVQKNIRINHVAVVNRGRAGHTVRLLGDSAEAVDPEEGNEMESKDTRVVRVDGADITVLASDVDKVTKLDADNSAKQKRIDELTKQIQALTQERDQLKGTSEGNAKKADAAEKELEDYKKKFNEDSFNAEVEKAAADRMDIIDKTKPYLGDSYDFTGKSAMDLKKDSIKAVYGDSMDLDNANDSFINGCFETLGATRLHTTSGYAGPEAKGDAADPDTVDLMALRDKSYGY